MKTKKFKQKSLNCKFAAGRPATDILRSSKPNEVVVRNAERSRDRAWTKPLIYDHVTRAGCSTGAGGDDPCPGLGLVYDGGCGWLLSRPA